MMKKLLFLALLGAHQLTFTTNYVFNLTGKNVELDFATSFGTPGGTPVFVGPLALGDKSPSDFLGTITATMLPPAVDLHQSTSSKINLSAGNKIKGSMKTPKITDFNDYKITLDGKKLSMKRLDTIGGIKVK